MGIYRCRRDRPVDITEEKVMINGYVKKVGRDTYFVKMHSEVVAPPVGHIFRVGKEILVVVTRFGKSHCVARNIRRSSV